MFSPDQEDYYTYCGEYGTNACDYDYEDNLNAKDTTLKITQNSSRRTERKGKLHSVITGTACYYIFFVIVITTVRFCSNERK